MRYIELITERNNRFNDAFWKWFGDSKVVDSNGNPLIVYKGMYPYIGGDVTDWKGRVISTSPASEIDTINRTSDFPAFNKGEKGVKIAGFFGDAPTASRFAQGMDGAVYPTYLRITHPYEIDANGEFAANIQFGESGKTFREAIRSGKYDGVIIHNTKDEGTIYIALDPSQIKSIHNKGTWNNNDPRISEGL